LYIRSVFFLIPKCYKLRVYLINKTLYIRSVFFLIPKYSKLSALTDTLYILNFLSSTDWEAAFSFLLNLYRSLI
jgi:hypothetical protein